MCVCVCDCVSCAIACGARYKAEPRGVCIVYSLRVVYYSLLLVSAAKGGVKQYVVVGKTPQPPSTREVVNPPAGHDLLPNFRKSFLLR